MKNHSFSSHTWFYGLQSIMAYAAGMEKVSTLVHIPEPVPGRPMSSCVAIGSLDLGAQWAHGGAPCVAFLVNCTPSRMQVLGFGRPHFAPTMYDPINLDAGGSVQTHLWST